MAAAPDCIDDFRNFVPERADFQSLSVSSFFIRVIAWNQANLEDEDPIVLTVTIDQSHESSRTSSVQFIANCYANVFLLVKSLQKTTC